MKITQVKAPIIEPVTLLETKEHLRLNNTFVSDDPYISALIQASRETIENWTRRKFITQTWRLYLDDFPKDDYILIPFGGLQSITSLKYTDVDDTETTFPVTSYSTETTDQGRLVLKYACTWPTVNLKTSNPICIEFVCGYGDLAASVPMSIRQAIMVLVNDLYEIREDTTSMPVNKTETIHKLIFNYTLFGY